MTRSRITLELGLVAVALVAGRFVLLDAGTPVKLGDMLGHEVSLYPQRYEPTPTGH